MKSEVLAALKPLAQLNASHESDISEAVADAFTRTGIAFQREVWLNDTDRIDYMVGRIGVELKLKGTVSAVTRQLARYADSDLIDELILVTTRYTHRGIVNTLRGKPVTVLLCGSFL